MNRSLYHFGIFFLGLTAACGLVQGIVQFLFEVQLFMQNSFIVWFLTMHTVAMIGVIVVLKYYRYQKYWAAFYTGMVATIASLCYAGIFFIMLLSRSSSNYYIPLLFIYLFISIVYAVILIFSATGKRNWLRIAGVYMLVITLVLVLSIGWPMLSKDVQLNSILGKIAQWTSMAGSLISVPFIMHFLSIVKLSNRENADSSIKESSKEILILVRVLALVIVLIIGVMVTAEGYSSIYWGKQILKTPKRWLVYLRPGSL